MSTTYDIVDISEKFNKNIKKLINIMNASISNNILFDTIKRRTKLVIDNNPLYLLEEGGVHIFKYREYIKNENIEELLLNFDQVIKSDNDANQYLNNNQDESQDIKQLLGMLKDICVKYSTEEKKIINKLFKVLLSEYCKFLSLRN